MKGWLELEGETRDRAKFLHSCLIFQVISQISEAGLRYLYLLRISIFLGRG